MGDGELLLSTREADRVAVIGMWWRDGCGRRRQHGVWV